MGGSGVRSWQRSPPSINVENRRKVEVKTCCSDCFEDDFLKRHIEENGKRTNSACNHCGSSSGRQIESTKLEGFVLPVITWFYQHLGDAEFPASYDSNLVGELVQEDFEIFSDEVEDNHSLLVEILAEHSHDPRDGDGLVFSDEWMRRADDYVRERASDFFSELKAGVHEYGHSLDPIAPNPIGGDVSLGRAYEATSEMLQRCTMAVSVDLRFWRGRCRKLSKTRDIIAPPAHLVPPERANQSGARVLYVASTKATALAELRPSIGDKVTLAEFRPNRELSLCRLVGERHLTSPFQDLDGYRRWSERQEVREYLGGLFSKPLTKADSAKGYLFTQYIAKMIKTLGFDGIQYRSSQ